MDLETIIWIIGVGCFCFGLGAVLAYKFADEQIDYLESVIDDLEKDIKNLEVDFGLIWPCPAEEGKEDTSEQALQEGQSSRSRSFA